MWGNTFLMFAFVIFIIINYVRNYIISTNGWIGMKAMENSVLCHVLALGPSTVHLPAVSQFLFFIVN